MLEIRRLTIFLEVAEHGSFTSAAEKLFMTHSAVSQQMATLERQLGLPLMIRRPRGIELTAAGKLLAERGKVLLTMVASLEGDIVDLKDEQPYVRLGAFPTAGANLIPRAVRDYQVRFPGAKLALYAIHQSELESRLRDNTINLGLIWDYNFAPGSYAADLERLHLSNDPLYALFPCDHPLAYESQVNLADLAGESWVIRSHRPPYEDAFTFMCRLAGFDPHINFITEDYQSAQGLVSAGVGIGIAPLISLVGQAADITSVPIREPVLYRRIAALRLLNGVHSSAERQMLEILRSAARTTLARPHDRATVQDTSW
jgi:DNA-binding transcriptional LysR family regulator